MQGQEGTKNLPAENALVDLAGMFSVWYCGRSAEPLGQFVAHKGREHH
jgi:hypothetical protein